nr:retrovirus-related Pol polyprotein from transposon TNT 1-94 [Tanacetum cinerariifolium]
VFSVATKSELNVARFAEMHVVNTFVEARCLALEAELATNDLFRADNDKVKQHYKQLYESIKITRAKHIEQVTKLTAENVTLKTGVSKAKVQPSVLKRTKHAVDVKLIVPRLRNNKDAHLDYLRHLKESVETIRDNVEEAKVVVQIVLWYLDSGCSKHMTGDRSWLLNFVKKFIGTVRFGNDNFGAIMGYGDYVVGESVISRVYYVKGLGHNLFSVGQFCNSDLEVALRKHSCYVRDTDGVDLIKGSRGSNLYTILVEDMMKSSPICLLSKASKNKSWLWHRHLNHLNFGTINDLARKDLVRGLPRLKFEKDHLCSAFIVDDYSRFTWVKFLRSKDETPDVVIKFITQIQVGLNKTVRYIRTDNGTEFANHTMTEYYEFIGIFHQKTVPKTPQQNGVVERVFGALCYPTNNSKDLGKLQPTADTGIFVGYTPSRKGSGPALNFLTPGQISSGLVPNPIPTTPYAPPTNKELEILFQLMFDEYLDPPWADRLGFPTQAVQAPVTSAGTPLSTTIDQDAPSPHISPSSSALQSNSLPPGVVSEPHSKASSSGDISSTKSPYVS